MAPWFVNWLGYANIHGVDAVAVANTYIVFTSIIFVGATVILAVAGYVFTQQFSATRETQANFLCEELKKKISSDEGVGIKLADSILDNPDVRRHLETMLSSKVKELVKNLTNDKKVAADEAANEAIAVSELNDKLNSSEG
jgi:hypothetical protein